MVVGVVVVTISIQSYNLFLVFTGDRKYCIVAAVILYCDQQLAALPLTPSTGSPR